MEIPIELVEEAWDEVLSIESMDAFQEILDRMQKDQPNLLPYLYAGGEGFLREDEIGELLGLGLVVWLSFKKASKGKLQIVAPQMLEDIHTESMRMLDENQDPDRLEESAVNIATGATQRPLLESVLGYLMEGENDIDPNRQGIAFFLMKNIVDALEESWNPPN